MTLHYHYNPYQMSFQTLPHMLTQLQSIQQDVTQKYRHAEFCCPVEFRCPVGYWAAGKRQLGLQYIESQADASKPEAGSGAG